MGAGVYGEWRKPKWAMGMKRIDVEAERCIRDRRLVVDEVASPIRAAVAPSDARCTGALQQLVLVNSPGACELQHPLEQFQAAVAAARPGKEYCFRGPMYQSNLCTGWTKGRYRRGSGGSVNLQVSSVMRLVPSLSVDGSQPH